MLVVGLTSGLGCGKTTVAGFFRKEGAAVINADKIVARLYMETRVKRRLIRGFKTANKRKIAEAVFSSKRKLAKLNAIMHPLVKKEVRKLLKVDKKKKKVVVLDVPLLFEAKMEKICDLVVVVKCSKEQQIKRTVRKFGLSRKDTLARINSQLALSKKIKLADVVIDNSGSKGDCKKQVRVLMEFLEGLI